MASQTNKSQIFIIFSVEGFEQAKPDIVALDAEVWVNPETLDELSSTVLDELNIHFQVLPENYDGSNEKSVMSAITYVEKQRQQADIFVEYI